MLDRHVILSVLSVLIMAFNSSVVAQDSTSAYPFLNSFANDKYPVLAADYLLLKIVAFENCEAFLTDQLIKTSFHAYWDSSDTCMAVFVDVKPQPRFESSVSANGRFKISDREVKVVFTEAAKEILGRLDLTVRVCGANPNTVAINLALRGSSVGTYYDGTFRLEGE